MQLQWEHEKKAADLREAFYATNVESHVPIPCGTLCEWDDDGNTICLWCQEYEIKMKEKADKGDFGGGVLNPRAWIAHDEQAAVEKAVEEVEKAKKKEAHEAATTKRA